MATTKQDPKQDTAADNGRNGPQHILEITTLAPTRPVVTLDDVEHEYRLMQDFGALEHQQFTRDSNAYDALWSKAKLTPAEKDRYERLLDRLFDMTLVDSKRVREQLEDRLTGAIKREILITFTNAPLLMAAMAQQKTQKPQADEDEDEAQDSSTTES